MAWTQNPRTRWASGAAVAGVVSVVGLPLDPSLPAARAEPTAPTERGQPTPELDASDAATMRSLGVSPESEPARRFREESLRRKAAEKELRRLRATHLGTQPNAKKRQEGIARLWEMNDPALFPLMLELFDRERPDVRLALLDIFADSKSDGGDAALTWTAIFDGREEYREAAVERLRTRLKQEPRTPLPVRSAIFEGLASGDQRSMSDAANLAGQLDLVEAIPWLIAAQVQAPSAAGARAGQGGGRGRGVLAWIAVGTQTAYVSGLTPVVAPGAVAFDQQISVITTGTLVRVVDAVVYQYNFDVHRALVGISSRAWGRDTGPMGFDTPRWKRWHEDEFMPWWRAQEAAKARAEAINRGAAPTDVPEIAPDADSKVPGSP